MKTKELSEGLEKRITTVQNPLNKSIILQTFSANVLRVSLYQRYLKGYTMKQLLASTFLQRDDEIFHEFEAITSRQFYALMSMVGGALAVFACIVHLM